MPVTETKPVHPMMGKYKMDGQVKVPDGTVYMFKAAAIVKDEKGPKVHGFVPCTMHLLVNAEAFREINLSRDNPANNED